MKTRMVLVATLALVTAVAATYVSVSLAGNDNELVQKLVDGSPWEGEYGYGDGGSVAGTLTTSFTLSGGELKGEIISITGRTTAYPGPLAWLEVKSGKVTFITPSNGVRNELRPVDGKLVGNWYGGRFSGWLSLSPKK